MAAAGLKQRVPVTLRGQSNLKVQLRGPRLNSRAGLASQPRARGVLKSAKADLSLNLSPTPPAGPHGPLNPVLQRDGLLASMLFTDLVNTDRRTTLKGEELLQKARHHLAGPRCCHTHRDTACQIRKMQGLAEHY